MLAAGDDTLDEQPQDSLARREVGIDERWPELLDDGFSARGTSTGDVGRELFSARLGESRFRSEPAVLGGLHPGLEGIQRHQTELIRIQQAILLLADLAHTVLSLPEPLTQLWRPTIGLLRPLAQLVRHGVRIE